MVRMPHWPVPLWHNTIKFGTERITALLDKLGNPQDKIPAVVHVTGTNGKGSTIAFLRSILEAAGYKVHCYTSPHLVRFNERIRVAGKEINDDFLYEITEEVRLAAEALNLEVTFFEGTTAIAFLAFARQPADIALIEVGLGGRLDATNVFKKPDLTVVTSISLDHTDLLGDTLEKISYEKAGILRPNVPCILSQQLPNVEKFFLNLSEMMSVPLIAYEYDYGVEKCASGFIYRTHDKELMLPNPNLPGEHQYINAANSITAALNLKSFTIKDSDIAQGIREAYWPGRLQLLDIGHLVEMLPSAEWQIWVDGAHNESGAQALSVWTEDKQDKPLYIIMGTTRKRDVAKFLRNFIGKVQFICGVLVENEQSAYSADYIAGVAEDLGFAAKGCSSLEDAVSLVTSLPGPARVLICGSLYLVGEAIYKNSSALRV